MIHSILLDRLGFCEEQIFKKQTLLSLTINGNYEWKSSIIQLTLKTLTQKGNLHLEMQNKCTHMQGKETFRWEALQIFPSVVDSMRKKMVLDFLLTLKVHFSNCSYIMFWPYFICSSPLIGDNFLHCYWRNWDVFTRKHPHAWRKYVLSSKVTNWAGLSLLITECPEPPPWNLF